MQGISIHLFTACIFGMGRAEEIWEFIVVVQYASEQRKEQRISVDLPVEITWYDPKGNMFTELTRIQDISKMGCRFKLRVELERGDIVSVMPLGPSGTRMEDEQLQLYEIRWTARDGTGWTTGSFKLEEENLAIVVFPPPNARNLPSK